MKKNNTFIIFFFVLSFIVFLQLLGIFQVFFAPLVWAVILALVFDPFYVFFLNRMGQRKNLAAGLMVVVVTLLTAGPIVFFSGTLVSESLQLYRTTDGWLGSGGLESLVHRLEVSSLADIWNRIVDKTADYNIDLPKEAQPFIAHTLQVMYQSVTNYLQIGAANLFIFLIYYGMMLFILFFFFRDGRSMGQSLKNIFPMTEENKEKIFGRLAETVSAVVRGVTITGVVQAILSGGAFWVLGVPYPLVLSLLVAFMALVPIGGAVFVWMPAAAYLALTDHWGKAVFLFIWGGGVVSLVDNILRPFLIGKKTHIPTLWLFLSIIGGLSFYGIVGLFLGPVMLTLFLTMIEIYRNEFGKEHTQ